LELIDLNTASIQDLQRIAGNGQVTSLAIGNSWPYVEREIVWRPRQESNRIKAASRLEQDIKGPMIAP